jgi:hypothetical protein
MWARLMAVASLASACLLPAAASAQNVFIGLSNTNGGFITEASGIGTASLGAGITFGSFSSVQVSATGAPILTLPSLVDTNTINTSGTGGTLWVAITETGLTTPLSSIGSSFTSNALTAGWTVNEQTFLNTDNALYGEETPLGNAVFTAIGTQGPVNTGTTTGSNFSVTMLYEIVGAGLNGNSNDTIDTTGVAAPVGAPGPIQGAGIPGIALAVCVFGLLTLRRRSKVALRNLSGAILG